MAKLTLQQTLDKSLKTAKQYVDAELAKKADSSHGTHVTWSTTTPKANGTATVGSETKVARGDHVHPLQTTVSGNAGSATKLQTARTLTIGKTGKTFDGSANVTWTHSDIGVPKYFDIAGQNESYRRTVIGLCELRGTNTNYDSYSIGRITLHRENGLSGPAYIDVAAENQYSGDMVMNISYETVHNQGTIRPCTFVYNGKNYGGIEFYLAAASYQKIEFYGNTNFDIFGVDYYNVETSTVINTEINDSLNFDTKVNVVGTFSYNGKKIYHEGNKPTPADIGALPSTGGQLTGKLYMPSTATSTDASHPTQLAYGLLGAYGSLKVLGNTDTSAGADNEYVHIAAGWGLSPTTDKGIVVYGTYAQCFGQNILTATHTASHAPANAQKNSDITKAEIEAKLTGTITSHSHSVATTSANGYMSNTDKKKVDILSEGYDKILFERFERGNITGNNPVTLNDFTDKLLIERYLVNDFLAYSVGEYYLGRLTTYLYFSAASDFTTTAYSDDGSTIYLNDKMVASISTCTDTEITLNFKKGWNKLVWVFNENTGGDTCTLTPAIRTATNFQYMNAYGSGTTTNDTINGLSFWAGSQSAYDSLSSKSSTTIYFITG